MSAEEWYARFRAMFETRDYADEEWRILSSVRVEDEDAIGELQKKMARQASDSVVQRVTQILEASSDPSARDHIAPTLIKLKRVVNGQ